MRRLVRRLRRLRSAQIQVMQQPFCQVFFFPLQRTVRDCSSARVDDAPARRWPNLVRTRRTNRYKDCIVPFDPFQAMAQYTPGFQGVRHGRISATGNSSPECRLLTVPCSGASSEKRGRRETPTAHSGGSLKCRYLAARVDNSSNDALKSCAFEKAQKSPVCCHITAFLVD